MLARVLRNQSSTIVKDLNSRMAEVNKKLEKVLPSSFYEGSIYKIPEVTKQKTMDEKLAELDSNVAKIEALREAGRPEEVRIRNLENKYGRTGRFPAYPWYGKEIPHEDKFPHLADRLGNFRKDSPQSTEFNEWIQLKSDVNNPMFNSPFVQEPTRVPDPDVDFEKGDVIYDNPYALQAGALAKQTATASMLYILFHVFHTVGTGRTVYPINKETGDHRRDGLSISNFYPSEIYSASNSDWHDIENLSNIAFISPLLPLSVLNFALLCRYSTKGVVTKMQFNKNRDLVFVTQVGGTFFAKEIEEVYETSHLQVLPPSVQTGFRDVSDRKLFTIHCMNQSTSFRVYTDSSYWNPELKEEFQGHLFHLWEE